MKKSFLAVLISLSIITGPAFCNAAGQEMSNQDDSVNLELHIVTDQNARIRVFIDGKQAIDESFSRKAKEMNVGIAPHKIFKFKLKSGKHTLSAETDKAKFSAEFVLSAKKWIVLYYVCPQSGQEQFDFEVYDHQVKYQ